MLKCVTDKMPLEQMWNSHQLALLSYNYLKVAAVEHSSQTLISLYFSVLPEQSEVVLTAVFFQKQTSVS